MAAAARDLFPAHRVDVAVRRGEDRLALARRAQLPRHAAERVAARDRLPVPELAARAHRAVALHGDVADLRRETVRSAVHLAVEDEPATDARSEGDHHRVASAGGGAVRDLAQRGGVGVVVDDHPTVQSRASSSSRSGAFRTPGMFGA